MIKILFVCHGNICRSPMAEFVLKDMVRKEGMGNRFHIESRATSSEEIWGGRGNPVYPPARRILAQHGISCEGKEAQRLTKADYQDYDYIIGMDAENMRSMHRMLGGDPDGKLSLLMDYTDRPRSVADPWYTGDFETTWNDVTEGCDGLLSFLEMQGEIGKTEKQRAGRWKGNG